MADVDPGELTPQERRALFRVVRGEPDDAELAALTVVLAAVGSAGAPEEEDEAPRHPRSVWVDRAAALRQPLRAGANAWRTSTWPR